MKRIILLVIGLVLLASVAFGASWSINLEWQQDLIIPIVRWHVYKSTTSGGPYTLVTGIPFVAAQSIYSSKVSLIVPDNALTTLYFVMTSQGAGLPESIYSNEVSAIFDTTLKKMPPPFSLKLR